MKCENCRYVNYIMNITMHTSRTNRKLAIDKSPHLMLVNNVRKRNKLDRVLVAGKKPVTARAKRWSGFSLLSGIILMVVSLFCAAAVVFLIPYMSIRSIKVSLPENSGELTNFLLSYATVKYNGQGSGNINDIAGAITPVVKTIPYVIRHGDTLSGIAKKYHLDVGTLIGFNKVKNVRRLIPGTTLNIPDIDGVPYTIKRGDSLERISKQYGVPLNAILDANDLTSEILEPGRSVFIPGAQISDYEYKKATGTLFLYPTHGVLTSPFGYRTDPFTGTRRFHYGIDLANRIGTPVRATMAGTVVVIGNHPQGYGNFIVLRHARGYQSLYGHLSAILVHKGQRVVQGQKIGLMGTTGRSTGPHLHFSIYKNHRPVNPLAGYLYR